MAIGFFSVDELIKQVYEKVDFILEEREKMNEEIELIQNRIAELKKELSK